MRVSGRQGTEQERFQHLFDVISSERFLCKQGLGNELPFFICPFPPEKAVAMQRLQKQLITKLEQAGVRVLAINLYDLAIELLQARDIWQQTLDIEAQTSKEELLELLQGVLDPATHLVPTIADKMAQTEFDVLFIGGVGEVYPFLRSHTILNNLQRVAKEQPTVLFFPGDYIQDLESGASLELFGRLRDDKYYRAFNIFDREV